MSSSIQSIVRGFGPCAAFFREASLVVPCSQMINSQPARSVSTCRERRTVPTPSRSCPTRAAARRGLLDVGNVSNSITLRTISQDRVQMQKPVAAASVLPASGRSRLVLSRTMDLRDAQIFGTIHGGILLDLMEEAGMIFSKQYCQSTMSSGSDEMKTVSGYLEKAEFIQPMFVGNLAEVHAEIGYTSSHSMQVLLSVYASTEDDAERRLTNRSIIWYVPVTKSEPNQPRTVLPVHPFTDYPNEAAKQKGQISYETMKRLRANTKLRYPTEPLHTWMGGIRGISYTDEPLTVDFSQTLLLKAISPSDCWPGEPVSRGGPILKLIDDVACIAAVQHCYHYCITVGVDSTFLFKEVTLGNCLVATAKVIFTSSRALELKVEVDEQSLDSNQVMSRKRAAESIITCLSLDESYQPREMPMIKLKTEEERKLFAERKEAYEERKRIAAAKRASKLIPN